ncbi:hypothetical protein RJ55_00494 [Drechmeria coniospora]|nr:hypothetical protein RJ55_00494 [Drechmeria coniospora]
MTSGLRFRVLLSACSSSQHRLTFPSAAHLLVLLVLLGLFLRLFLLQPLRHELLFRRPRPRPGAVESPLFGGIAVGARTSLRREVTPGCHVEWLSAHRAQMKVLPTSIAAASSSS